MMLTRSIVVNTFYQALGKFGSALCMFGATLLLARFLGGEMFGEFTTVVTYLSLFYMSVDLGLNQIYLHVAGNNAETHYAQFFNLRLLLGVVVSLVAIGVMWVLTGLGANYTRLELWGVAIGVLMIPAYALVLTTTAIFQNRRHFNLAAIAQGIGSFVTLLGILFWISISPSGVIGMLGGIVWWTIGTIVTSGLSIFYTHLKINLTAVNWRFWADLFKRSASLALALLANHAYVRWGILSLSWYRPAIEVGQYGLAFKFFEVALSLPIFFMNSYYPDLLEMSVLEIGERAKKLIQTLFLGSLVVTGVLFVGAPLLSLVRVDFAQSVPYLRELSLITPIFFVTSPLVWYFVMYKKQQILAYIYGLAFLLFVVISPDLVIRHGASGAIMALGITEALVLAGGWGYIISLRRNFRW